MRRVTAKTYKEMSGNKHRNKIKSILKSPFTLPILTGIQQRRRPSKIAQRLRVTDQVLHYHIQRLIDGGLVTKECSASGGITWNLTDKGDFVLKEKLRWSVGLKVPGHGVAAVRLHGACFSFRIKSMPDLSYLHWTAMKNGVTKCTISYEKYIVEIIRSTTQDRSVMLIHILGSEYFYDCFKGIIKQYNDACGYACLTAERLNITICERGYLVGKPHMAFDPDLITLLVADSQTAETTTTMKGRHKAWFDSSNGQSELETDDPDYAYLYLTMPQTVSRIAEIVERIERQMQTTEYQRCHDPVFTENN
jgi:DNA-binding MarR family transcriptional regulator